jgi:kynurenine formamidase
MKIIDLSRKLSDQTPTYPGDKPFGIERDGDYKTSGFITHIVDSSMHVSTHMDAPVHMIKGGKNMGDFSVEKFIAKGVLIDARKLIKGNEIQVPKNVRLFSGAIVLVMTGMDKRFSQKNYFSNYPALSRDFALWLITNKVSIVGTDSCSPDFYPFRIHKMLLGKNILIIENLTNLEKLKKEKSFEVVALPIKTNLEGSWVRVVARIL